MFRRLWRDWFSNPKTPVPVSPPTFENAAHDEHEIVFVSAFHHENICYMMDPPRWGGGAGPDRYNGLGGLSIPELNADTKKWLDENTPGYTHKPARAANFLMEIKFANGTDAVKFKLFWL